MLVADGSCKGNPGPGGYGCILRFEGHERLLSGGEPQTTNNRMELMAVIKGLECLTEAVAVEIVTDSKYVVNAFTQGWLSKWAVNGWKTSSGPVKNRDLWERLVALLAPHRASWRWVKGHAGHVDNERADALAQAAASALINFRE